MRSRELDLRVLTGPFQLEMFYVFLAYALMDRHHHRALPFSVLCYHGN